MSYNIVKSDGTTLVVLADQAVDASKCSLTLVGRGAYNYGESIANNFVRILENFASGASSPPLLPLNGQTWFERDSRSLNLNVGTQGSPSWKTIYSAGPSSAPLITVTADQLISTAVSPRPPFVVSSNALVANLNADYVNGYHANIASTANTVVVRDANSSIFCNIMYGTATSARYADLAERFEASQFLEAGDVVMLGGEKEIQKASSSAEVLGVISSEPGFRMNVDAGDDSTHPFVAYVGRLPVKVIGMVKKFDTLYVSHIAGVASTQGTARVGVALEEKTTEDEGRVLAVVGR